MYREILHCAGSDGSRKLCAMCNKHVEIQHKLHVLVLVSQHKCKVAKYIGDRVLTWACIRADDNQPVLSSIALEARLGDNVLFSARQTCTQHRQNIRLVYYIITWWRSSGRLAEMHDLTPVSFLGVHNLART